MTFKTIPYDKIKTISLDAGNTLVAMDFYWLTEELKAFDIKCGIEDLRRAEASARPLVSAELKRLKSTENRETSVFYMQTILNKLPVSEKISDSKRNEVVEHMLTALSSSGRSQRLWTCILPGVGDALEIFRENGYQLIVASNSNGTVENILAGLNLREYFDHIFDSHFVGYEKPDPLFFHHALNISEASPETTLHVGDLYHVDILGAWNADMHAVILDPFDDWKGYDCVRFPDLISVAQLMKETGKP